MSHPLGLLFVCLAVVLFLAACAWNFIPSWRTAMRGYSTMIEAGFGVFMSLYGELAGGIQDAQAAGYLPPQIATYVPIALFLWFLLKRVGTSTPVGQK